ncbi:hypothetical protein [Pseudorhodoferax sp.]|uniref:hypothetical protein n=1 Tax=Pseudorhodoferax sp. TaxID=1993553 RepID=UPI002DD63767|nr:hypothetical protein [Pseudorhodoferax sp.]
MRNADPSQPGARALLALAGAALGGSAAAGAAPPIVTVQELRDAAAPRLTAEEVRALFVPGTVSEFASSGEWAGWVKRWNNSADGRFVIGHRDVRNRWTWIAQGSWRIRPDGAYCIQAQWTSVQERWCLAVYRHAGAHYLGHPNLATAPPGAQVGRLTVVTAGAEPVLAPADWSGRWQAEGLEPGIPWGAELTLEPEGGTWRAYLQVAPKFAPCLGKPIRISNLRSLGFAVTFKVVASEVVNGCDDHEITLMKVDDQTLEGQFATGGPIRLTRP